MEINDRIHMLRQELGLTMKDFGAQISLSQPLLSLIENGKANITDRTIAQICATWNINEEWLRTGKGPQYGPTTEEDIKSIVQRLSLPEICVELLNTFDTLEPDQQEAVLLYAKRFILTLVQNKPSNVTPVRPAPSQEEAAARQILKDRQAQETSHTSVPGSSEIA